jgi:hypothetical protein
MVAMVSVMEPADLLHYVRPFVGSLSRFTEEGPVASILKSATKGFPTVYTLLTAETREIAEEGLKLIQTKLGTTAYLENLNAVRQDILGKRQKRKMKRSIEVVTDPERAAKKKIRQHDKVLSIIGKLILQAKENRKRKVKEFKDRRLAYGR